MTSELTREEARVFAARLKEWPTSRAREVLEMTPKERDVVGLLVALLDARPVDKDGWPEKDAP